MTPVGSGRVATLPRIHPPRHHAGRTPRTDGSTRSTTGRADEVAELCRRAEATGADSLWAVDHLYWPHPIAEAFTTLAVAAVTTTRPLLGTCVLQLPLRPPAVVAKQATALQLLSGGRFVLGLGVGIHESEYVRAGVDYHRRGQLMDEGVAGLRQAWAGARRGRHRLRAGAGFGPVAVVVRRVERRRTQARRRCRRRLGAALPCARRVRDRRWRPCGARRPRPAGIPRPCRPASSSSPAWATTTRRPSRAPSGCRSSTASRPRRSSATWWPARPRPAPPPSTAMRRRAPATSS